MNSNNKNISAALLLVLSTSAGAWDVPSPGSWFPVGEFGAPRVSGGVTERVMDAPDFIRIAALNPSDPDIQLSRKIGLLVFEMVEGGKTFESSCSGSLVGPDLFLTNHHCIANGSGAIQNPSSYIVAMEYLKTGGNIPPGSVSKVVQFLVWDESLDFALLKLSTPLGTTHGWLELETDENSISRNRNVKIIQHPAGRPKEIVRNNTSVVNSSGPFLHYLADTEGGSSGSPVFGGNGERVIALHHVGTANYNEGVKMSAIAPHLSRFLPVTGATMTRAKPATPAQPATAPAPQPAAPPPAQRAAPAPGTWTPVTGD